MQNNHIIDFLDLEDPDIEITDLRIEGNQKIVTLETKPTRHFCPICSSRMYSRGTKPRTVFHPILQDSYELVLKIRQRLRSKRIQE